MTGRSRALGQRTDLIRVRPWGKVGDRKNDGYLRSERILFQCYAPNELSAKACIAKIDEDFEGALPHWQPYFDTWVFVHNSREGLGPEVTERLLALDEENENIRVTSWGLAELRQQVFGLSEVDLAALLGPAPTRQAMMDLGLADLAPVLDQIARLPAVADPDLRPVPATKLEYNCLSPDAGALLQAGMQRAPLVRMYFKRSPGEQVCSPGSPTRTYSIDAMSPNSRPLPSKTFLPRRKISKISFVGPVCSCPSWSSDGSTKPTPSTNP